MVLPLGLLNNNKMIHELLHSMITEVMDSKFQIEEFIIGEEFYEMLKDEIKVLTSVSVMHITHFQEIKVTKTLESFNVLATFKPRSNEH